MTEPFHHQPVMVDEITKVFEQVPPGVLLDATLGGGGHAERLLERYERLSILGLDRDEIALTAARQRLARFGDRLMVHHCRFDRLEDAMEAFSVDSLSGALFDLGVSSPQLDDADRVSRTGTTPLDMRMDRTQAWTAADVVNGYPVEQQSQRTATNGSPSHRQRSQRRSIETTTELAAIVVAAIRACPSTGGHPASAPSKRSDRGQRRARRVGASDRFRHRAHRDTRSRRCAVVSLG